MLGLTRPQLAYRLKRLHESETGGSDINLAPSAEPPTAQA
jgi:hypothetical protein